MMGRKGMRKIRVEIEVDPELYLEEFMDVIREAVDNSLLTRKQIAQELDISPSSLTRKLANNPGDSAYFPLIELPRLITILNDTSIIDWLNCRYRVGKTVIKHEIDAKKRWHEEELEKLNLHENILDKK